MAIPLLSRAFSLLALGLALSSCASFRAEPQSIRFVSGSEGGTYHRVAQDLASYINATQDGVVVSALATRGSTENLDLLARGGADLALVTEDAFHEYLDSHADAADAICAVGPLYVGAAHFIVPSGFAHMGTMTDLEGLMLYPGARGSGTEASTIRLLHAVGVRPLFVRENRRKLGYAASATALRDRKFDAVVLSGGPPVAAVADLFDSGPTKYTILRFTPEQIERAIERIPGIHASQIDAGTYAHQRNTIPSVGKRTLLVARSDVIAPGLKKLSRWLYAGFDDPTSSLKNESAHPILQGITPAFWAQPLGEYDCRDAE